MITTKSPIVRSLFASLTAGLLAVAFTGCSMTGMDHPSLSDLAHMPAPALPQIPEKTFRISDYGTKGDGKTNDTGPINYALESAEKAGGGTVEFTAGTYLTSVVHLRSNVGLRLDRGATLLFTTNPADYPVVFTRWEGTECYNYSALITGTDLHDIAITGEGTIDGQGAAWWPWKDKAAASQKKLRELGETTTDPKLRVFGTVEGALRPCLFEPIRCRRILLAGVKFTNSPFWTIHPTYCSDITAHGLDIHGTGPNTDGFDPDSCKNILITECKFDTGDDCITLKSGRDKDARRVGLPTENVTVRNCTFARGHGTVVIGSEMSGGVRNVYAENLTADGTDAGVRIKTRIGRGGTVENIFYNGMTLKNILKQAITIDMFYDVGSNPDVDQSGPEGVPIFRNITIENVKCESAVTALLIQGLPQSPMTGITLRNLNITASDPVTLTNAPKAILENVIIKTGPAPKAPAPLAR